MQDLEKIKKIIYQLLGTFSWVKDETRNNLSNRLAQPIFVIVIICLLLGTFFYLISGYRSAFPNGIIPEKKELSFPPKTLSYNRLTKNQRDEAGLYRNLFEVFVYNPAGNTENSVPMQIKLSSEVSELECEVGSETGVIDVGIGVASTTVRKLYDCVTRKPIIDNGELFSIATKSPPSILTRFVTFLASLRQLMEK